ncbi:CDP-alcohol phosphatidyltransferase family protein [Actinoallomurus sp. NPDC052308]|uniref:CDP-alcohol phosphatidyltransferase family protein n=1 Tax=Actinoallomurus sp. NPDC052308 TaxID=3155530 RepID=UPI003436E8D1
MNDRLWTWPNVLSFARLIGVPVFLWLVLVKEDWWALGILVFAGLSDWLDGKLARMLDQTSELGTLLDPAADRLYIFATLIGLVVRGVVPLWVALVLVAREVYMAVPLTVLRRHDYDAFPVHFVGKTATLCLLYAFPLLFLGAHSGTYATVAKVIGWAFTIWGTGLYWWAAVLYTVQVRRLVLADRGSGELKGAEPLP